MQICQLAVVLVLLLSLTVSQLGVTLAAAAAPPADPNKRLEQAARTNDVTAARAAVADGADINTRGDGGQTPIMAATLAGSTDIVRWLLSDHGDKVDFTLGEKDGYTPMHAAGFQGRAEIAKLLVDAGLNPSDRHRDGFTPLHRACWGSGDLHTDTVKFLIDEAKVDVNEPADSGQSPLDSAGRSNPATAELLRSRGGKTAAELADRREL